MPSKECEHCHDVFTPDARLRDDQRVCARKACLRWRAAQGRRQWQENNPDYHKGSADRHRPGYWKDYRRSHPKETERNRAATRERLRRRRALFATQDSIRKNPSLYLQGLRRLATEAPLTRCIDGIISYLDTPGVLTAQNQVPSALEG